MTGMRSTRARAMAPAIAAISRPPRQRSMSASGSVARRGAASPASTTAALRARPASSTPVPRPTQSPRAAEQRGGQRSGDGGVADAHLAGHGRRSAAGSTAFQPVASAAQLGFGHRGAG
jgi:hypothetical protein